MTRNLKARFQKTFPYTKRSLAQKRQKAPTIIVIVTSVPMPLSGMKKSRSLWRKRGKREKRKKRLKEAFTCTSSCSFAKTKVSGGG